MRQIPEIHGVPDSRAVLMRSDTLLADGLFGMLACSMNAFMSWEFMRASFWVRIFLKKEQGPVNAKNLAVYVQLKQHLIINL